MPGPVFLEGEKVELRTIEEEDLEFLQEGVNHPDVRVHTGNRLPQNMENEREFFDEHICNDESLDLLICDGDTPMGIITLDKDETKKVGVLGIWIHPDFHGKGFGTAASRLLIEHSFNQLNYHKVWARVHSDNEPSQNLWEKLGFKQEAELRQHTYTMGEYKDVYMYGLLRGEWK